MTTRKKATSRVQVNGKAGSGRTINMSGLARVDEFLRENGIDIKVNFTGTDKKLATKNKALKSAVKKKVKRGK